MTTAEIKGSIRIGLTTLVLISVTVLLILPPDRFTVIGCALGGYQLGMAAGRFIYKK